MLLTLNMYCLLGINSWNVWYIYIILHAARVSTFPHGQHMHNYKFTALAGTQLTANIYPHFTSNLIALIELHLSETVW